MKASAQDRAARTERFNRYEARITTPLLINGFLFVAAFIAQLTEPDWFAASILWITWVVFLLDYMAMVWLHPQRWRFVTSHLYYIVALIFPPLRVLLLVAVANRALRGENSPLRDRIGLLAIYMTSLIIVFGALFTWQFERHQPGANIKTFGDSLWWAVVSITTVGYGDFVPVTVPGRLIATVVFITGIAALAVLTGVVVSYFTAETQRSQKTTKSDDTGATVPSHQSPSAEFTAIELRLAAIEAALAIGHPGGRSETLSDEASTIDKDSGTDNTE